MDKEKFDKVMGFFKEEKIEVPTDVANSIEDVFSEMDNIIDVQLYYKNNLRDFEKDIMLHNKVDIDMRGYSTGTVNNTWTYYGNIQHSLTEHINLVDENGLVEEISTLEPSYTASVINPDDWAVLVWEKVSWESAGENRERKITRETQLYIYAPCIDPSFSEYPEEYRKVEETYNKLKSEENQE